MKPKNLQTKIFLDSGDPEETTEVIRLLGFLDGQTTNPTLVAKNPEVQRYLASGKKLTEKEAYTRYREIVSEVSRRIPAGSVSIEVYADHTTPPEQMFAQGRDMFSWIPNAHVKYPILTSGLAAAEMSLEAGMRVNMTLCFNQAQAAAVYAATRGPKKGDVFVSPFVGRLDDRRENGMLLIKNILEMYTHGDGHTEVLTASVRSLDHFLAALALGSDVVTAPAKILREWAESGLVTPNETYVYETGALNDIPYQELDLERNWREFDIRHELTETGIERFVRDWRAIIA